MASHHLLTGGHAAQGHTFAQQVEAIGETLGDVPLQVAAQYYLIVACYIAGDYRGTEDHCWKLMQLLQGERTREQFGVAVFPAVLSRALLAYALAERGMFDEGDAHGHEAIRMAETLDHPYSIIWACLELAYLNNLKGGLSQAAHLLECVVALCREWTITIWIPVATASLGHVYARSGRLEEGMSWLQQSLTAFASAGNGLFYSLSVMQLGEVYLLADQVEDARACAARAVRLARKRGERGHEAWALRLLGDLASHQDCPDLATAEAYYGAALALADELAMRPLAAHCHRGLGTLYAKIGRRAQAHAALSTAIELYRDMAMTFWLPQAEAVLVQVAQ